MLVVYTNVQIGIPCHQLLCKTNGWSKNSCVTLVISHTWLFAYWMFWENVLRSLGTAIRILIPELNHPRKFHIHVQYLLLPLSGSYSCSCTTQSYVIESKLPSKCGNPLEHSLTHHKITLDKTPGLNWVTLAQACSYHRHIRQIAAQITHLCGNNMMLLCFC